jgi:hypothetical protein
VAIVGLALWTFTVAAGVWLLATSTRERPAPVPDNLVPENSVRAERRAATPAASPTPTPAAATAKDRFDPPSLRAAKTEPIPGLRALAEFMHPALAVTGFAFWLLYTLTRDMIFAAIALGVMLGAIAAGVSWATVNARAGRRGDRYAMSFSPRVLAFHVAGAALTLLVAALIATHVTG